MRRIAAVAVVLACVLPGTAALAATGTLPGGTSLSVTITSPTDGAIFETGVAIPVTGTASVGAGVPVHNTTVVYALDVSLSTALRSGVDCNGDSAVDTVLFCERQAVRAVNAQASAATSPVLNSGLATFATIGRTIDLIPGGALNLLLPPGASIDSALASLSSGGLTNFAGGLNAAKTILNSGGAAPVKIVVFLSDGLNTVPLPLPTLPTGTVVKAFAIGGVGCGVGFPTLNAVAAKGAAGSSCTKVTNLALLDDIIGASVGSSLNSLETSVDGGAPVVLTNASIDPDLPQAGPASVTFSTSIGPLPIGPHQVCATARGSDAGGPGFVTHCVHVEVVQDAVDCSTAPCVLTANDGNVATANFRGFGITKVVGLRAGHTTPADCGGQGCVTAFDVLWNDNGGQGTAQLTVVTSPESSTPLAQAAVYIDGVQVTTQCAHDDDDDPDSEATSLSSSQTLPCATITRISGGRNQYFVEFRSDPGIQFR